MGPYILSYRRGSFPMVEKYETLGAAIEGARRLPEMPGASFPTIEIGDQVLMSTSEIEAIWAKAN